MLGDKELDFINKNRLSLFEEWSWDIKNITNNGRSFSIEPGNHNIVIAIIDSGIDADHPDLKGNIVSSGKSFIANSSSLEDEGKHGTMVAGQIAANGNLLGVGPGLGLIPYKTIDENNKSYSSSILNAIDEAINNSVDIINLSLGSYKSLLKDDDQYVILEYKRLVKLAKTKGIIVVASAGTESLDINKKFIKNNKVLHIPGDLKSVINVMSSTKENKLASYSNFGFNSCFSAPGGDLGSVEGKINVRDMCLVTYPRKIQSAINKELKFPPGYEFMIGTSLATAKVSGVIGVIQCRSLRLFGRKLSLEEIQRLLYKSSNSIVSRGKVIKNINLYNALKMIYK